MNGLVLYIKGEFDDIFLRANVHHTTLEVVRGDCIHDGLWSFVLYKR